MAHRAGDPAIHTGLRQANLFGMRREWIDFDAHVITIPGRSFKKRVRHRCKMSSFVEELLRQILDEPAERSDSKAGHLQADGWVRNIWRPAIAKVDLSALHFHDLRATCATRLLEAGATEKEAAAQLGVSLRVIQRYVRIVEAHQLAVLGRASEGSRALLKEKNDEEEVAFMRRNVRLRTSRLNLDGTVTGVR